LILVAVGSGGLKTRKMPRVPFSVAERHESELRSVVLHTEITAILILFSQIVTGDHDDAYFPLLLAFLGMLTDRVQCLYAEREIQVARWNRGAALLGLSRLVSWDQIEHYDDVWFKGMFRFKLDQLKEVFAHLREDMPADGNLRWPMFQQPGVRNHCHVYNQLECFLMALHRFATCETLLNNARFFALVDERQSEAVNAFCTFMYFRYHHCLKDLKRWAFLSGVSAWTYLQKGYPVPGCVGCLDGKLYRTGRPIDFDVENAVFSFHHRAHGIVFLLIVAPCGLHIGFFGPVSPTQSNSSRAA
jgi:hypothetical protein